MIFDKYLNTFKDYLQVRNYSSKTIELYKYCAKIFFYFVEEHYPRVNAIEKITKTIITDYQNYIANYKSRGGKILANQTQRKRLQAIKLFFIFLYNDDYILSNPTKHIVMPKIEERIIRNILTKKEIKSILQSIKTNSPVNIRNKAIIEIAYATGIRTAEFCNLKKDDIDLKEQTLTIIKGKGNKSRIVPLTQYAVEYTKLYLRIARKYFLRGKRDDPGYLFLTSRGVPFTGPSLNLNVIRKIVRKAGIKKHISFYCFRHSVATHLLANKVDIAYIAQLLGHACLSTTQNYTRIEISDLKRVHSLTHPREKTI